MLTKKSFERVFLLPRMILIFLNKKQNSLTGLVIFMIMSLGIEILNNDAVNVPFDYLLKLSMVLQFFDLNL